MDRADHVGMSKPPPPTPLRPDAAPDALLDEVVELGLTRLAVPTHLGGLGGEVADLSEALAALAARHIAAAWLAWSQRLVVEALVQSPNVALREHLLPDLLDGSRAGALSWRASLAELQWDRVVQAQALPRGWQLSGRLEEVPNLQWAGYAVVCPVAFQPEGGGSGPRLAWVLLRCEEDGLKHELDRSRALTREAACGDVSLRQVYFREDELLADDAPAMSLRLSLLDQALRPALLMGALQRGVHPAVASIARKA